MTLTIIARGHRFQREFTPEEMLRVADRLREWRDRYADIALTVLVRIDNVTHIVRRK